MMKKLLVILAVCTMAVVTVDAAGGRVPTHHTPAGLDVYTTRAGQLRYVVGGQLLTAAVQATLVPGAAPVPIINPAPAPAAAIVPVAPVAPAPAPGGAPQPAVAQQQPVPAHRSFIHAVTSTTLGKAVAVAWVVHAVGMGLSAMQETIGASDYLCMQAAATIGAYFMYRQRN